MADMHDIIKFSCNGEKIFGIVIEHYANPLDEFSIVYADYSLHKVYNIEEDAIMMIDNIIIPACDNALTDFRLRRQHLKDVGKFCDEIEFMKEAMQSKLKTDDLFDDAEPL